MIKKTVSLFKVNMRSAIMPQSEIFIVYKVGCYIECIHCINLCTSKRSISQKDVSPRHHERIGEELASFVYRPLEYA